MTWSFQHAESRFLAEKSSPETSKHGKRGKNGSRVQWKSKTSKEQSAENQLFNEDSIILLSTESFSIKTKKSIKFNVYMSQAGYYNSTIIYQGIVCLSSLLASLLNKLSPKPWTTLFKDQRIKQQFTVWYDIW